MNKKFVPAELEDYYRGKKVIVIGGAGFIGQQLARLLTLARADVLVLDNFSRGRTKIPTVDYKLLDAGSSGLNYLEMSAMFQETDVVFNLAATVAGVLFNQKNQLAMYYTNIRVLTTPVAVADDVKVPVFLQTSSVCVYAPEHNSPCDECCGMMGTPHPANAGYAEAKRDGERAALWADDIQKVVIVRPSNVAGPGDYFDEMAHVIPAFVKRAFYNQPDFMLYGNPYATREFIHPKDVASGMMYAAAFGEHQGIYNIGTNDTTTESIIGLTSLVLFHAEKKAAELGIPFRKREIKMDSSVGGGDERRWSNAGKLNQLGWLAKFDLDTIVSQCVADYAENYYGKDPWDGAVA